MLRAICVCSLLALFSVAVSADDESAKKAPTFSLMDLGKKEVVLDSLLGKGPVVIDFWATWCKPCMKGLDHLRDMHKKYKDRGLSVVAINEDDPRNLPKVKPMAASHRWDFYILIDSNKEVKRLYHVAAFPTTFVLDAEGNIRNRHIGYTPGSEDELKKEIENLLLPLDTEPDTTFQSQDEQGESN